MGCGRKGIERLTGVQPVQPPSQNEPLSFMLGLGERVNARHVRQVHSGHLHREGKTAVVLAEEDPRRMPSDKGQCKGKEAFHDAKTTLAPRRWR